MGRQGRAGPALAIAAIGSFFAGCVGTVLIALFGPPLAELAFEFGAAEYFSMMVLGLIGGAAAMERSAIRQRINGANGLVFLVAGVLGLLSVPVGGAVTWYLGGLGTALVAGLGWWAWTIRHRFPDCALWFLAFFVTLTPVFYFRGISVAMMSDRYLYIPSFITVVFVLTLLQRSSRSRASTSLVALLQRMSTGIFVSQLRKVSRHIPVSSQMRMDRRLLISVAHS